VSAEEGILMMAALQMASGATDEEWPEVMKILSGRALPDTSVEVVAQVRAALDKVRAAPK
jgi:hypothetical protein